MCLEKRKPVMKAYIISQFGYCPLVWMFHSRGLHNKRDSLHERVSRTTYGDRSSLFEDLLKLEMFKEMLKVKNNIAPEIMKKIFAPKMSLSDLRNNSLLKRRRANSV